MSRAEVPGGDRAASLRMLIASSIRHQSKRSLVQVLLVAAVVVTGGACVIAGRGGGRAIVDSVEESGASLYAISANSPSGNQPEPVDVSVIEALGRLSGINYISAQATFAPTVSSDANRQGQTRQVLAVSDSYLQIAKVRVAVGNPVLDEQAAGYGVLLGRGAAADFGITDQCVLAQSCHIQIDGNPYLVSAIIAGPAVADGIFIDLATAIRTKVVDGPAEVIVSANGLPAATVRRSLDLIASSATDQVVFVRSPASAAALREGVSTTWRTTIAAMAVLVLAMGVVGQIAIQRAIVRSRRTEIATLRSIGYPPRFVVVQFLAEPIVLATAGALVGFAALILGQTIGSNILKHDFELPLPVAAVLASNALVVSAGASMLAANSASKVSPAEILHG